ncbi:MAG: hypothetical protein R3C16_10950 [Hyphomonadaceae bacterium]
MSPAKPGCAASFTHDVSTAEDYEAKLAQLPFGQRLAPEAQALALRYAHHFFFRRMLELPFVQPAAGPHRFVSASIVQLISRQRVWRGLDVICRGILEQTHFCAE